MEKGQKKRQIFLSLNRRISIIKRKTLLEGGNSEAVAKSGNRLHHHRNHLSTLGSSLSSSVAAASTRLRLRSPTYFTHSCHSPLCYRWLP